MDKIHNKSGFPNHSIPFEEKEMPDYGLQVLKAIEDEWFRSERGGVRFFDQRSNFHRLRLYARGEQPIAKYQSEMAIDGDLSHLNVDWTPISVIPKFVDIVVNGISERPYSITAYAQDPESTQKRTAYVEAMINDMNNRQLFGTIKEELGLNMFQNDPSELPYDTDELSLKMQLDYKESIEIAEEEAISNVFALNKFDLTKNRADYDIATLGVGCLKHEFNTAEGIVIKYVDPANIVYSYTESPYFDDLYYVGEVERLSIPELKKRFPLLTDEDVEGLEKKYSSGEVGFMPNETDRDTESGYVYVLHGEYKTYKDQVYKLKGTPSGSIRAIDKPDTYNPPKEKQDRFEVVRRSIEVLFSGSKIVGYDKVLEWRMNENMTRPKSDVTKVNMSYNIVAPKLYNSKPDSLVQRMIPFADRIQMIHLKLQQVSNRITPDGVFIDADGIAEIDLGNGTTYSPQDALNMYFQTGSVLGRSYTQDGEFNHGKEPVREIRTTSGGDKTQTLIAQYNYYLNMMRDVTGLNEARDGSTPDKDALVGLQKLAAANSNTATRHILNGGLYLALKTAEGVSLRISDVLEFANTREQFLNSLGKFNLATLTEIKELHLHDFGLYISLAPDVEEKQMLENNIQMALNKEHIDLADAIDIREVRNIKLANQLLKLRRRQKQERERQMQMENIQAQTQSNAQAAEAAAQAEVQKEQAIASTKAQLAQVQNELDIRKLDEEARRKKELMQFEYELNMRLKKLEHSVINTKEKYKEDRKDERSKMEASQQSELIQQRQNNAPPKRFESAGFDTMDGFGLEQFEPS